MEHLDLNQLNVIVQVLRNTAVPDTNVQRQVTQQLEELNKHPDFNKYLTYIFVTTDNDEMLRKTAGLALKSNINLTYHHNMDAGVKDYIRAGLVSLLGSGDRDIRRTVANVITTIAAGDRTSKTRGIEGWPELIPMLIQSLQSPDRNHVESAFEILELLCDDLNAILDRDIGDMRPVNLIIPQLLAMLSSTTADADVQVHCLSCLNKCLQFMPAKLVAEMGRFLQCIFALATAPQPMIRKNVCEAFTRLVEQPHDHVFFQSGVGEVIKYMLVQTNDAEKEVALEACEFWTAACINNSFQDDYTFVQNMLRPHLQEIVPVLLKNMCYTEDELSLLEADEDEDTVEDKDEDVRPTVHRGHKGYGVAGDDDDDDDDDDADPVGWNIRKSAAAGLDNLAIVFREELWLYLQPLVENNLNSAVWVEIEASVLALGAVADGCIDGLRPHLGVLIQYLLQQLDHPRPLIRSITCWTLSRFGGWMVDLCNSAQAGEGERVLKMVLEGLLRCVAGSSKRVQRVACSAVATLEDEAQDLLAPHLDAIVSTLMFAFERYQAKNMLILYDALGTLANAVGESICKPQYGEAIVPRVIQKWATLDLNSKQMLALLECLTDFTHALGAGYKPYAVETYMRCCHIVGHTLMLYESAARAGDESALPELDPVVWSLDLVSALCDALGPDMEQLIVSSQPPLMEMVFKCIQSDGDELMATKQSALALCGDLAKSCPATIIPHAAMLMPALAANLDPRHNSICNNASWALGEISLKLSDDLSQVLGGDVMERLAGIIMVPPEELNHNLLQNCAITIGRIGLVAPAVVAPKMAVPQFMIRWCDFVKQIQDVHEKQFAYRGLIRTISHDAMSSLPAFASVYDCMFFSADVVKEDPSLGTDIATMLQQFKVHLGQQGWANFLAQFDEGKNRDMAQRFGL